MFRPEIWHAGQQGRLARRRTSGAVTDRSRNGYEKREMARCVHGPGSTARPGAPSHRDWCQGRSRGAAAAGCDGGRAEGLAIQPGRLPRHAGFDRFRKRPRQRSSPPVCCRERGQPTDSPVTPCGASAQAPHVPHGQVSIAGTRTAPHPSRSSIILCAARRAEIRAVGAPVPGWVLAPTKYTL
jgi:hypothetical protein